MTSRFRSISQPLPPDISRKTVKTVPLKLSKYLYQNAFYHYEEEFIRFSLNSCTRTCATNCREYLIVNMGYFVPHAETLKVFWIHNRTVEQQYLLHISSQYGELRPSTAEMGWRIWGTPANFNGFLVLASLLHRRRSTEVNQTSIARRLTVS